MWPSSTMRPSSAAASRAASALNPWTRRRRGGRGRGSRDRAGPPGTPRRGAHGHPDARKRRAGRDQGADGGPGHRGHPRDHPHDLRPRPVRVRAPSGTASAGPAADTTPQGSPTAIRVLLMGILLAASKATRRLIEQFVLDNATLLEALPRPHPPTTSPRCCAPWSAGTPTSRSPKTSPPGDATAKSHVSSLLASSQGPRPVQLVMPAAATRCPHPTPREWRAGESEQWPTALVVGWLYPEGRESQWSTRRQQTAGG